MPTVAEVLNWSNLRAARGCVYIVEDGHGKHTGLKDVSLVHIDDATHRQVRVEVKETRLLRMRFTHTLLLAGPLILGMHLCVNGTRPKHVVYICDDRQYM